MEKKESLIPTLPNLYGLDVRFKFTERQIKMDKDRRSIKRNSMVQSNTQVNSFDQSGLPPNRHGSLARNANQIAVTSYK